MNWVGDLIQENIEETDTILDLGCGIMQATLDIVPSYPKTKLKCKRLLGVDIHQPYLDYLNTLGIETLNWDLRKVPIPFKDKSFDIVLLTDILEHLDHMEYVNKLISESIRIARKKLIALTPIKFDNNIKAISNPYPYEQFKENNEFLRHHLLIKKEYLEKNGFKVEKKGTHHYAVRKLVNKILHVWDLAGVASIMCKYQNRLGYNAKVYINEKFDTYRFSDVYKENTIYHYDPKNRKKILNQVNFISQLKKIVDNFKPDIIHFHGLEYIPIFFKLLGYKILIEFHGTRIRHKYYDGSINPNRKTPRWMFRIYWLLGIPIFVSTPDLLRDVPKYNKPRKINRLISNPVDKDIFNISRHKPISETALFYLNHYDVDNLDIAINRTIKRGYKILIHDREKGISLNHLEFANYLSNFECYVDRIKIDSLSKTALECLAMGLKVIDWKNDIIKDLPHEHDPYNVARKTLEIYDKIMVGQL